MRAVDRPSAGLRLALLLLAGLGAAAIVQADLAVRRAAFETDARIAHRLLSQRASQHDAILGTLALLQPPAGGAEQRLPAFVGQVLQVLRRDAGGAWPGSTAQQAALAQGEAESRRLRQRTQAGREACERYATLSAREREVLALVVAGLSNKEAGRALGLSPRTVETHRAHLSDKLGAPSLAQLVRHYADLVEGGA
jgi:DNA-binding CsgD family transcriptional regulator